MHISYFATIILLIAIKVNSINLSKNQQKCLINLTQNLYIKQIVIVSESNKLKINNIRLIKNIQHSNIFAQFFNFHQLNYSISHNVFKGKTLHLLDLSEHLPLIFNDFNELYLSRNVWVIFNKTRDFKRIYIPYNCQFIAIESENDQDFNISEIYNTRIYTNDFYISNFGKWEEENNLRIFKNDFYQRRFNMNDTFLVVINNHLVSFLILKFKIDFARCY